MMRHTIRIYASAEPGRFAVTGAAQIADSDAPVKDAAKAILAAGASEHDTLRVIGADCSIADMPLWKLAANYRPPLRSALKAQARH